MYVLWFCSWRRRSSGGDDCWMKTSVASIITLVLAYFSLNSLGILSWTISLGRHKEICLNWRHRKLIQVVKIRDCRLRHAMQHPAWTTQGNGGTKWGRTKSEDDFYYYNPRLFENPYRSADLLTDPRNQMRWLKLGNSVQNATLPSIPAIDSKLNCNPGLLSFKFFSPV